MKKTSYRFYHRSDKNVLAYTRGIKEKDMAVDLSAISTTDVQNLLKNVDLKSILGGSMAETTGGLGIAGGTIGAVLLGALLPRLLGDTNAATVAAAAAGKDALSSADVQAIVTGNTNSQTLGGINGEIWKAEGTVQTAISASQNAAQMATLNAEIANLQGQKDITQAITNSAAAASSALLTAELANLQGQAVITKSISDTAAMNATQHGLVIQATQDVGTNLSNTISAAAAAVTNSVNTGTSALLATTNALASQAATNAAAASLATLQAKYDTAIQIGNDGDKTRASIAALAASIPNARELDLQRQLTVAQDDHRHTGTRAAMNSGNVEVITNVNQAQAQAQAQQQQILTNGLLGQLIAAQHATNTAVTIGNGNRPNLTATNVGG